MADKMQTPGDVLRFHPEIAGRWNASDIGYLLRLGLIRGKKQWRGCLVYSEDVIKLFNLFPSKK